METPEQYLQTHPEIKLLISLFSAECVHEEPASIRRFAFSFFRNEELERYVANSFGFEGVAAHVKAQVNQELENLGIRENMRRIDEEQAKMMEIVKQLKSEIESGTPCHENDLHELLIENNEEPVPPLEQAIHLSGILQEKESTTSISMSNLLLNGTFAEDIEPESQLEMSAMKVKLVELAEFAYKAMDFTKFKDLGNAFLVFPPLRDQFAEYFSIATRPVLEAAFPRALTIETSNSLQYELFDDSLELFECHAHGVGFLELIYGIERLMHRFPAAVFICTNLESVFENIETELKYFPGIGKSVRYLASRNNEISERLFSYLPVILKGNYKQEQVEDLCLILVSFVPNCFFEREFCFRKEHFYEEHQSIDTEDNEVSELEEIDFDEMPRLRPLNAKEYDHILEYVIFDLRSVGVNIDEKNVKFMNLGVERPCNFDNNDYSILHSLIHPLPRYDNPNWEFWFDTIINSMDNRDIENYDEVKIDELRCFGTNLTRNIFCQLASFKNMVIARGELSTHLVTRQEIRDVLYIEPLMYYIDQCLHLSNNVGMLHHARILPEFKLLQGHYFKRLNSGLHHDPVLTYIANSLHRLTLMSLEQSLRSEQEAAETPFYEIEVFSYKCLVGYGPLFENADIFHSLNCEEYCQCTHEYLGSSQFYFPEITAENVFSVLPGLKSHGKLLTAKVELRTFLKALTFHYEYNIFNRTFAAHAPSFPYLTEIGLFYDFDCPEQSFLFDERLFRAAVLSEFEYENINGNMLSNVFLHEEIYISPEINAAKAAEIEVEDMAEKASVILDLGCFEACQLAHALRRFGVVLYENSGDLADFAASEEGGDQKAGIDVVFCYPCSLVTPLSAQQHVELVCRSVAQE